MKKFFDQICVIGLGFVGLTTALSFTNKNLKVLAIDKDNELIRKLKKSKIPFKEPSLNKKLKEALSKKKIVFQSNLKLSKSKKYIFFICVGTPVNKKKEYDISSVKKILKEIYIKNLKRSYVYLKSTVLPGTVKTLSKNFNKNKLIICSNPEFLREGYAWVDFNNADKIVVGHEDGSFIKLSRSIYKNFKGELIFVNPSTAEFIKQLSNALLSNLISFSNMFALLGEKIGDIDINKSFKSLKLDKRFYGNPALISSYIHPGLGFGGYCLPKDIAAISKFSERKINNGLFENIIDINANIFKMHFNKILSLTSKKDKLYILGLSFKDGSDDLRFSKSIDLVKKLYDNNYKNLVLCDQLASDNLKNVFQSKKFKIRKKPLYEKKAFYVLCSTNKSYVNFLKKVPQEQIIDTKYKL